MKTFQKNVNRLNQIAENCIRTESRQLTTLNKLRKMNGKQTVSSISEHRLLKKQDK